MRPDIALVNEQAWSSGLVSHYLEAGYKGIFMDYDNPARFADWDEDIQFHPQRVIGVKGESIPVLWSRSMVFQKLQRFAHGEIELSEYQDYLESFNAPDGWMPVYGNDAEIFDYRPGRYKGEADYGNESEWDLIASAFNMLKENKYSFHLPSTVLNYLDSPGAGKKINLCTAQQPVPVKKQSKYNITRWAVSGRDDFRMNSLCRAVASKLENEDNSPSIEKKWKELCFCWSSDFRTHITPQRFFQANERLRKLAESTKAQVQESKFETDGEPVTFSSRLLEVKTEAASVTLNTAKGLTVHKADFATHKGTPSFGTLEHGYFKDISLGADFFSGHLIMEGPGSPKETDLCRVQPLQTDKADYIQISGGMEIHQGHLEKAVRIHKKKEQIDILYNFQLKEIPQGFIRLGHVTLLTANYTSDSLYYEVASGGEKERFSLDGKTFDHSRNVSFLVSSAHGAGMTDSALIMGGKEAAIEISPLVNEHAFIAMITCRQADPTPFVRVAFSMQEMDETCMHNTCENKQFNFSTGFSIKPSLMTGRV